MFFILSYCGVKHNFTAITLEKVGKENLFQVGYNKGELLLALSLYKGIMRNFLTLSGRFDFLQ
jgi:hypothetical protein